MDREHGAGENLNVDSIVAGSAPTPVSDELGRLHALLAEQCPDDAVIRFEYDGRLKLHVDVRLFEDVALVEGLLPSLCGGIFRDIHRGMAGSHSFHHRISALVRR